jgi:hypothetical protein
MLLKRTANEGVVKSFYESSNILASEYKENVNELTIVFKHGGQYKYFDVPLTDYTRFEMADSQGKVLNTHIKKYSFEALGKIDAEIISEEVKALIKEELQGYAEALKTKMLELISEIDAKLVLSDKRIDGVVSGIEYYIEKR